jgi:hypothetical protein
VEVDADRISLHYITTEVDADRTSVRQHIDKEGDQNSKSMINLEVQDQDIKSTSESFQISRVRFFLTLKNINHYVLQTEVKLQFVLLLSNYYGY